MYDLKTNQSLELSMIKTISTGNKVPKSKGLKSEDLKVKKNT